MPSWLLHTGCGECACGSVVAESRRTHRLERLGVLADAGDVVEGGHVVRRVLGAIPRQVLGDVLDVLTSLVKTEMRWGELDDSRSHREK